jgi:hypothetical protein
MPEPSLASRLATALVMLVALVPMPALPAELATAAREAHATSERQRIEVGPNRVIRTLAAAAILARDGALIEVEAGTYRGDTAVWTQNDILVRAVGGGSA